MVKSKMVNRGKTWVGFVVGILMLFGCGLTRDVVHITTLSEKEPFSDLGEKERAKIAEIKKARKMQKDQGLENVIQQTRNLTVRQYLSQYKNVNKSEAYDYKVGGYDVIDITIFEEPDLSRQNIRVTGEGYISFPFIGRLYVENKTTTEIAKLIESRLAEGQFILDAHVSVDVREYRSKQYMVLGAVEDPGTYSLQGQEKVLDAISKAGGIDFEEGTNEGMIIRTVNNNMDNEHKITIRIDFAELLKGSSPESNLLLMNNDLLYVPEVEYFYIIGEVKKPGSYPYNKKDISLVEAISIAGGFTQISARNRTRIVRLEEGREKIITVKVDAITDAGRKAQDVLIRAGDVVVVPESFF
jgi:polysaccharide export outer membrane protein